MMFQSSFALFLALAFSTTEAFQPQPYQAAFLARTNRANSLKPAFLSAPAPNEDAESIVSIADPEETKPGFLGRLFGRNSKVEQDIKAKAQAIKTKATESLASLEERLDQALQEQTDQLINAIALDFVDLFNGHWDLAIATTQDDTKTMMEGSIEELADDLIELGVAEASNKNLLKQDLSNSRLKIAQTFDGSDYPLRLKQEVFLGAERVIELYGQFQFDLLEHRALYSLDELIVLGTKVDLEEIIREAAAVAAAQEQEEEPTEEEQQELISEIATTLDVEADDAQDIDMVAGIEVDFDTMGDLTH